MQQFQGLIGIALIIALSWACSENRAVIKSQWKWTIGALLVQFALAIIILRVPFVWDVISLANQGILAIEQATSVGTSFMFGYAGGADIPFVMKEGAGPPLIIAFQILPLIVVFSALAALLWHWGVLQFFVRGLSWLLQKIMGVSGVVGLSGGANIFLGLVESPMLIKAYLGKISRSELFMVMVLAMSTISGAILILYATTLSKTLPNAVGHMIAASLISLPAALVIARIMVPEDRGGSAETTAQLSDTDLKYENSIDAIVRGTLDGVQLLLAVVAVIIVIFALVALVDQIFALLPLVEGEAITLRRLLGWIFAPLMWAIGVPWGEAADAGALMGTKAVLNEYVAYLDLAALGADAFSARSQLILTYALCGVANLASVGLLVSTIGTLCPQRRGDVAKLGMRSWIAGNFATAMTGAVVGLITLV